MHQKKDAGMATKDTKDTECSMLNPIYTFRDKILTMTNNKEFRIFKSEFRKREIVVCF